MVRPELTLYGRDGTYVKLPELTDFGRSSPVWSASSTFLPSAAVLFTLGGGAEGNGTRQLPDPRDEDVTCPSGQRGTSQSQLFVLI